MSYTKEQLLEAADVLDKAHDVILERGWWPGDKLCNQDNHDSRCMDAAIIDAMGLHEEGLHSECSMLGTAVGVPLWLFELMRSRGVSWQFNDRSTEDEVFDRLRSVAKELREEASL